MWNGILLLMVIIGVVSGYRKGLVQIALTFGVSLLAVVLVALIAPLVSEAVVAHTSIDEEIASSFTEHILSNSELTYVIGEEVDVYDQVKVVESIEIPEFLKNKILLNNNLEEYKLLGVDTFIDYVGLYIANWIIKVLSFILVFILVMVFLKMFVFSMLMVVKLPLINSVNRIGGACVGFLVTIVMMWILFLVSDLMYQMDWSVALNVEIENNAIIQTIYRNNLILEFISR